MTCRVVFFSDLHLNKLQRFWPNHLERQRRAIMKPLHYAIQNGIQNVLIGGDISEDPWLSGPAMTVLFKILNAVDGKLNLHIILGNHDVESVEEHSLMPLVEMCEKHKFRTVRVYAEPEHVKIDGVHFNMLPYPHKKESKVYAKGPCVNMAHLEWQGAMRDNLKSRIKDGYDDGGGGEDVWLIGHLHTPQYLKRQRVLYCGTLFQTNFGENADKSFCDIQFRMVKGQLKMKFDRIPSDPGFMLQNLHIRSVDDLSQLSKDSSFQYKLWMADGVKVPRDLQLEYPNIRYIQGMREEVEAAAQVEVPKQISMRKELRRFLDSQGLTKSQRVRALQILTDVGAPLPVE